MMTADANEIKAPCDLQRIMFEFAWVGHLDTPVLQLPTFFYFFTIPCTI